MTSLLLAITLSCCNCAAHCIYNQLRNVYVCETPMAYFHCLADWSRNDRCWPKRKLGKGKINDRAEHLRRIEGKR